MEIIITTGKGMGKTPLSAFDAALKDAGVHNYNLLVLSSIIPPGTTIRLKKYRTPESEYGHRLYVVMGEMRSHKSGQYIGAAVGWHQLPDGRGVFVEHDAIGETELAVRSNLEMDVKNSIMDLCKARNYSVKEKEIKMALSISAVKNAPASVLAIAVYKAESWSFNA